MFVKMNSFSRGQWYQSNQWSEITSIFSVQKLLCKRQGQQHLCGYDNMNIESSTEGVFLSIGSQFPSIARITSFGAIIFKNMFMVVSSVILIRILLM